MYFSKSLRFVLFNVNPGFKNGGFVNISKKEIYDLINGKKNIFFEAVAYRSHPQTSKLLEILKDKSFGQIKKIDEILDEVRSNN